MRRNNLAISKLTLKFLGRERGSSTLLNALTREDRKQETCKNGEVVKYLRTHGFMFDSANGMDLRAYNLDICIDACTNNVVGVFEFKHRIRRL